ncbi:8-oxoguanine DNA glycosylase [Handroanthus impetiginosus]|uniref:DNA-(apurinic or apyrimidinic site) lyase n=1 Tax=Handroanthus impetiginosus TaxID=429701 RepID=A0A2G9HHS6_9LAMI|nr:8-oxoguanine DNA glycosylase [Handroanthus impetiginosus]
MQSPRSILSMKRPKTPFPPPPATPPTPQQRQSFSKLLKPISKRRRNILQNPHPLPSAAVDGAIKWKPLNINKSELYLPLTFPTGQTFRWKETGPLQYTGPVGPHLVSLKQLEDNSVGYYCHFTESEDMARTNLFDLLNMGISLNEMWNEFKASDGRFAELALYLEGARVLRQDPLECLIQFICSSNNNIQRITKMVDFLSSKGKFLGNVGGSDFFEFPTLERLALVSEAELREAGFGYRAKYIVGTVTALQSKPGGGVEWLASLRKLDLQGAIDGLSTLPGVGPKVAACIALFSLDQHHAIPVDTHVWQIATRYLIPELAGTRLTPKICNLVADAFVSKYGKYAGWAQTLLFISELPSQKAILPSSLWDKEERSSAKLQKKIQSIQETKDISGKKRKKTAGKVDKRNFGEKV